MNTREILTLQLGHYSNFVGAHWWNLQELGFEYDSNTKSEVDNDVLYREGLTDQRQTTFTPRLLLVDLNGSLGALPERGNLYDTPSGKSNFEWEETKVEVKKEPITSKNQLQQDLELQEDPRNVLKKNYNLDEDVKVWSDFLYSKFHPRTVNVIKEYGIDNDNYQFNAFPLGLNLWKTTQFEDDFVDKIRNYVEECDNIQGFQILTDITDAFSGLTSSCLEYLQTEYSGKAIFTIPLISAHYADYDKENDEARAKAIVNDSVRVLNAAFGFEQLGQFSSLFVPLCMGQNGWRQPGEKREFPHLIYDAKLPYHTSAILATALETITLKYRLNTDTFRLADLCTDLTHHGRTASAATLSLPFPLKIGKDLLTTLDNWEGPLTQCITPSCTVGNKYLMQHYTLRGIEETRLKKPLAKAGKQRELPAYNSSSVKEMLEMFLAYTTHASANNCSVMHKGLKVCTPFPKIFKKTVGFDGNILDSSGVVEAEVVPVIAGLHNGVEVGKMLETLHEQAKRIKVKRLHQFADIESDDFEERLQNLLLLRENYYDDFVL